MKLMRAFSLRLIIFISAFFLALTVKAENGLLVSAQSLNFNNQGEFVLTVKAQQQRGGVAYRFDVVHEGKSIANFTSRVFNNCSLKQMQTSLRSLHSFSHTNGWLFTTAPASSCPMSKVYVSSDVEHRGYIVGFDPKSRKANFVEFTGAKITFRPEEEAVNIDSYRKPNPNPNEVVIPTRFSVDNKGNIKQVAVADTPNEMLLRDYRVLDNCMYQRFALYDCNQRGGKCAKERLSAEECHVYEFSTLRDKGNITTGFFQCVAKNRGNHAEMKCLPEELKFQQGILKQIYEAALESVDKTARANLKATQAAYEKYVNQRCGFYNVLPADKQNKVKALICKLENVVDRRTELERFVPMQEEED